MKYLINRFFKEVKDRGIKSALNLTLNYFKENIEGPITEIRLINLRRKANSNSTNPEIIKEFNGSKMALDISKSGRHQIEKELALNRVKEPGSAKKFEELLKVVKNSAKERVAVLDIGANVGYYTLMEANILGDKGKIYAVEPDPDNTSRIEKNAELNGYTNIEILNAAIGSEISTTSLQKTKKSNLNFVGSENTERSYRRDRCGHSI